MTKTDPVLANLAVPDVDFDPAESWAITSHWFQHHWIGLIVAGALAAVVITVLFAVRGLAVRYCNRDRPGKHDWWLIFGKTLARTMPSFIIMLALQLSESFARPPAPIPALIHSLFTISFVIQGAIWARELILGAIERRAAPGNYTGEALESAIGIIRVLVTFAVFAVALIVVLDNLGVNVTGLVAGLGIGGIAIGLAAQGIFADLFAALAIILDRPFRRGDTIGYDKTTGTVEAIGLKSTRLRSPTGEERIIANRQLLDKEIQNITAREYRRYKFTLALIYQTPPELAARLPDMLREVVRAEGGSFVRAGFVNFSPSSLDFELEFDGPTDFDTGYNLRHAIGLAIAARFAKEGVHFAYPTQTAFTAAPDGTLVMPYPAPESGGAASQ
ncbi:mechanosensitive ion channel family protein [Sphingomonas sp. GlSt437]|uniref:mechanosensitive ion channel family protein n=1 Tax=Sphingomonas sp. GlSt437 TaxID=3389970 RepID=UPI003A861DB1